MKVQEAFQPDWFQALSDGDTDKDTGKKRLIKAVNNTLDFLDDTLELQQQSEVRPANLSPNCFSKFCFLVPLIYLDLLKMKARHGYQIYAGRTTRPKPCYFFLYGKGQKQEPMTQLNALIRTSALPKTMHSPSSLGYDMAKWYPTPLPVKVSVFWAGL